MNPFAKYIFHPLAISENGASRIRSMAIDATLNLPQAREHLDPNGIGLDHDWMLNKLPVPYDMEDGTRVIPLFGAITRGFGLIGRYYGFADTDLFAEWITDAAEDPGVMRIAIHIQSPGGDALGCYEAAEAVRMAGKVKPTMVFCDEMMASAAYFIGCAAHALYVTPSSYIGSIGTYTVLVDDSEYWEKLGIKWMVVRSGEYKGAGIDGFSEDQIAMIQKGVDTYAAQFRAFVTKARPSVSPDDMRGQAFIGHESVDSGLADFASLTLTAALRHNDKLIKQ